ncbi:MAG: SGNH/GDSL hydrolase family protein [Vicinamibacterales bacterium]
MPFSVLQKPMKQKVTIVALGDSTTAGTPGWKSRVEAPPQGVGDETSQYAWWLMEAHPDWQVLNHGVDGERSDQIRGRFERDVVEHAPRAVVIIAGVNDVYQGREAQHVIEQLAAMYGRAAREKIPVVAGTIVPYNTATKEQNAGMRAINDWIRTRAAEDPNVSLADTRAAVAAADDGDRLFESPDNLHPSPAGYRRMADAIRPVLETVLKPTRI